MRALLVAFLMVAVAGCGTTADVMRTDATVRAPSDPAAIQVLLDEPSRPYTSIAMVTISDEGYDRSLEELKAAMVAEVAKLGGDAVIVGTETRSGGTVLVPAGNLYVGGESTKKLLVGKVIVFRDAE